MQRLDGKILAEKLEERLKQRLLSIQERKPPTLVVFLVGEHLPSQVYVRNKRRACERVGIRFILKTYSDDVTEKELVEEVICMSKDDTVDGILIQTPLPQHIAFENVIDALSPEKDVDGFHPMNVGKLLLGREDGFVSCTPLGIQTLLAHYGVVLEGKNVVILGRSAIVGKPLAALLLQKNKEANATVTVVHRATPNPKIYTRQADILIAAMGAPRSIRGEDVKEGVVIVDVGINQESDATMKRGYRLVGDIDFPSVKDRCAAITPVPGGVGPMTIAMLLENTMKSYEKRHLV